MRSCIKSLFCTPNSVKTASTRPLTTVTDAKCAFCGSFFRSSAILHAHLCRHHADPVSQALRADPVQTYTAIFGSPKRKSDTELRFGSGLVVSLKGEKRGLWFDFVNGVGGGPLGAIKRQLAVPFAEAMDVAVGILELDHDHFAHMRPGSIPDSRSRRAQKPEPVELKREHSENVERARELWSLGSPIRGTLAETYLTTHRGISSPGIFDRLEFRFLEPSPTFSRFSELDRRPALLVPVGDDAGKLFGVQRIILDSQTGAKPVGMRKNKFSLGRLKDCAGLVQQGQAGDLAVVAEGPETAAALACAVPTATILASLSVSNLVGAAKIALARCPSELVLAADNDGDGPSMEVSRKAFAKIKEMANNIGVPSRMITPDSQHNHKTDWNDVLKASGVEGLASQIQCLSV